MNQAIDQFHENFSQLGHLRALYAGMQTQTKTAIDLTDILRARLVMAVSAFDLFIHELVLLGMLESYFGHRAATPSFLAFKVPMSQLLDAIATPSMAQWLEEEIRQQHGWKSFQAADKVAEAIRLISPVSLYSEVGIRMSRSAVDVKETLNLIVDRRNKIAHESDCVPSTPGSRWPISISLVDDASDFLALLATSIFAVV